MCPFLCDRFAVGKVSVESDGLFTVGGFKGGWGTRRPCPFPNMAPNNFQEKSSGVSRMQENLTAAGSPPRTPPRELISFSRWGWGDGWLPLISALWALPLTRNRKLGSYQHDVLDPPILFTVPS